jgi:hypothetical protein
MTIRLLTGGPKTRVRDPFELHSIVLEEVIILFDQSVWACRHVVRNVEKVRNVRSE